MKIRTRRKYRHEPRFKPNTFDALEMALLRNPRIVLTQFIEQGGKTLHDLPFWGRFKCEISEAALTRIITIAVLMGIPEGREHSE